MKQVTTFFKLRTTFFKRHRRLFSMKGDTMTKSRKARPQQTAVERKNQVVRSDRLVAPFDALYNDEVRLSVCAFFEEGNLWKHLCANTFGMTDDAHLSAL